MPINKKMMKSMEKAYGKDKAKSVYYAVEAKQKVKGKSKTKKKK